MLSHKKSNTHVCVVNVTFTLIFPRSPGALDCDLMSVYATYLYTSTCAYHTHTRLKTQTESPYTDCNLFAPSLLHDHPSNLSFLTARACQQAQKQGDVCMCGGHV